VAEKEKELKKLEIAKLKEQWERDLETEKLEKESVIAANKQVYKDIEEFNKREDIIRSKRSTIEKIVIILTELNFF
jgi:exosome complex RNA-binding protein Csl4